MKKNIIFLLLILLSISAVFAAVNPSTLFCDHVVLQRNVEIPVWGIAGINERVSVKLNDSEVNTVADAKGNWMLKLPAQKAGGPFILEISGENTLKIQDVYVGDVWLCSGQSNMDMTVAKEDRYWCGVDNEAEEVANADYPLIRIFDVDYTPANEVKKDVVGRWEICSPQTVGHFSAVAYFFAHEIYTKNKVPVGMITSAFGASTAETWISKEALAAHSNLVKSGRNLWLTVLPLCRNTGMK